MVYVGGREKMRGEVNQESREGKALSGSPFESRPGVEVGSMGKPAQV